MYCHLFLFESIGVLTLSAAGMPPRSLTSSGRPLNTRHNPELYTFFNGAQHADGSFIALSHSYSDVTVILVDIVGMRASIT